MLSAKVFYFFLTTTRKPCITRIDWCVTALTSLADTRHLLLSPLVQILQPPTVMMEFWRYLNFIMYLTVFYR